MSRNIEIKARCPDLAEALQRACQLTGSRAEAITQDDTFFAGAAGRLKLRVLADGEGQLIHYHRPDAEGPKVSDYVIVACADPDGLRVALTRAYGQIGRVRKHRWLVMAGRTRIHFDEVADLGSFVELEVVLDEHEAESVGIAEAHRLLGQLGIRPETLVSGAYLDLLAGRA